jgi:hypothetical protein
MVLQTVPSFPARATSAAASSYLCSSLARRRNQ